MESSRDSSVWRNLAVTFGGGLALGAVGMKITQSALRPAEFPSRPAINPVTGRLSRMEQRLERVEQTPAPASPPGTAQLDQKVLEAVVGAVDARLHEHSAQVERRLADLDARITVELHALHQQDRHFVDTTGKDITGLQHRFLQEVAGLRAAVQQELGQFREAVSMMVAGQGQAETRVVTAAAAAAAAQCEERMAPLRAEVARVDTRAAALERSVETRVVTAAAAAAAAQFEEQLAPLRAEVERKERELADLRHRLTESEGAVLDVILAIGQLCRQAAERMGGSGGTRAAAAPQTETVLESPAPNIPADSVLAVPAIAPHGTEPAARQQAKGTMLACADIVLTVPAIAPNGTEPAACQQAKGTMLASADAVLAVPAIAPNGTEPAARQQAKGTMLASADSVLTVPAIAPNGTEPAARQQAKGTMLASADAVLTVPAIAPHGTEPAARQQAEQTAGAAVQPEPGLAAERTLDQALPDFLQPSMRNRWRMPLVSSLLITTGAMLLVRYL